MIRTIALFILMATPAFADEPVYQQSECIGAIVNGVCYGAVQSDSSNHPVCHGEMLNGQCTGPVF